VPLLYHYMTLLVGLPESYCGRIGFLFRYHSTMVLHAYTSP
jgi:hypothetical protein